MKISVTHEVSDQMLKDILITAVEGGSDYWAIYENVVRDAELNILSVLVTEQEAHDDSGPIYRKVTPEDIGRAIVLLAASSLPERHIQSVIDEDVDAETADVLMQLAVLGDVIYG